MRYKSISALLTLGLTLLVAACSQTGGVTPAPTPSALPPPSATAGTTRAAACAADQHAPLDAFRPDPVSKLTASTKPKLIEFYAVW